MTFFFFFWQRAHTATDGPFPASRPHKQARLFQYPAPFAAMLALEWVYHFLRDRLRHLMHVFSALHSSHVLTPSFFSEREMIFFFFFFAEPAKKKKKF